MGKIKGFLFAVRHREILIDRFGFIQNTVLWTEFIYYFCGMIVCVRSNRNVLVEWLDFIHNFLIVNYKATKNLPFDLFI